MNQDRLYLTAEELKKESRGTYKFVKVNNEFRFVHAFSGVEHKSLVDDGETAEAAGFIALERQHWRMGERWSSSLKLGCNDENVALIATLLAPRERKLNSLGD